MSLPKHYKTNRPLSAPAWLWLAYHVVLLFLVLVAPQMPGMAVLFTAAFSFQFWTFVAHRGMIKDGYHR